MKDETMSFDKVDSKRKYLSVAIFGLLSFVGGWIVISQVAPLFENSNSMASLDQQFETNQQMSKDFQKYVAENRGPQMNRAVASVPSSRSIASVPTDDSAVAETRLQGPRAVLNSFPIPPQLNRKIQK